MTSVKLNVVSGSGAKSKTSTVSLSESATVADLKNEYSKLCKKSIHRLSFKKEIPGSDKPVRLDDDRQILKNLGVVDGDNLVFKDLGPQIGYRDVFVIEYAGPLFIMLLYASRPEIIFGVGASSKPYNWVAKLGVVCWVLHFLKREFETYFIHKFSRYAYRLHSM